MYEMCRDQELSISDLGKFDAPFFMELCEVIETGRQDRYEDFSFAVVRLLLLFNDQYTRKNSATLVLENLVVTTLSRRIHRSKTLSENIVFMFNRSPAMYTQVVIASSYPPYSPATTLSPGSGSSTSTASTTNDTGGSGGADAAFSEAADQMSVLKFLFLIFTTESLYQFFYTNDIKVIVDVVLREVERCDDEEVTSSRREAERERERYIYDGEEDHLLISIFVSFPLVTLCLSITRIAACFKHSIRFNGQLQGWRAVESIELDSR